jgi:hypothetical protein
MKIITMKCILLLLAGLGSLSAAPLSPVVLATTGDASIKTGSQAEQAIILKQAVPAGSILSTGTSRLALAVAPGQMVTLKRNTQLQLISTHDAAVGKGAELRLISGGVRCDIDPKYGHAEPVFKLYAGKDTIQAKGTQWETGVAADGSITTVVISSTVSISVQGGTFPVDVPAGSVLVSSYDGGALTGVKVVNLATGGVTSYATNGEPTTGLASATEMSAAAAVFQTALNENGATGGEVAALVAQINQTLVAAGLPATVSAGGTTTTSTENNSAPRDTTVSGSTPPTQP